MPARPPPAAAAKTGTPDGAHCPAPAEERGRGDEGEGVELSYPRAAAAADLVRALPAAGLTALIALVAFTSGASLTGAGFALAAGLFAWFARSSWVRHGARFRLEAEGLRALARAGGREDGTLHRWEALSGVTLRYWGGWRQRKEGAGVLALRLDFADGNGEEGGASGRARSRRLSFESSLVSFAVLARRAGAEAEARGVVLDEHTRHNLAALTPPSGG